MTELSESFDAPLGDLLGPVIALAREAGEAILKIYAEVNPSVEYKKDSSPLTHADLASHRVLVDGLTSLAPGYPVLSEESSDIPYQQRMKWRRFWLVDPLDGTKEFLRRNGEFTVNIALMQDGSPVLGVVSAPVLNRLYCAAKGAGSWRVDGEERQPIHVAGPRVGTVRVVMSRTHGSGEENLDQFTGGASNCEFVSMGSSLKFCLVAEGAADVYPRLGPTMEWDTAAAQCVVEQAGGTVTDLDGNPMRYNKPNLLNPGFVAKGDFACAGATPRPR